MLQPLQDPSKRFFDQVVVSPSYIIFQEGGKIYAKNGKTGQIEFQGTDASTVIQNVISALAGGGVIYVASDDYVLKKQVVLRDNISIVNDGRITGDVLAPLFYGDGIRNVKILGSGWIRQSKVNIYGQAGGNFNTTYPAVRLDNCSDVVVDHEVGGFPTTSDTDSRPKGPAWSVRLVNCSNARLWIRGSYALEHLLVEDSKNVIADVLGRQNYDSGVWILRSDNVHVRAVLDLTDTVASNGVEVNTSRNVVVDAVVVNPAVHGVWLYFSSDAGQDMYNVSVRAVVHGGGNGVRGVEGGDPAHVYNINIEAEVHGVSGKGVLMEKASHGRISARVYGAGEDSLYFYRLNGFDIELVSVAPGRADMYDHARDTDEGLVSSNLRLVSFSSDTYSVNVYPQVFEYPYRYTLFLKDYSLAAGEVKAILPINARSNVFWGKVKTVYVSNSAVYVQLYNVDADVVQNEDNTSGTKNWPVWKAYNYQVRLRNSDTVNAQTTDVLVEIQSVKPLF